MVARTLAAILALSLVFSVVFAPASLLRRFIPADAGAELVAPAGTLWNGRAEAVLGGRPAGDLAWRLDPVTFLHGALGYHAQLSGPGHDIALGVRIAPRTLDLSASGHAGGAYLNQWLDQYDIALSGDLRLESLSVRVPWRLARGGAGELAPGRASGMVLWTGGPVRYRLSGEDHRATLPPMEALLGDGLEAVVYARGNETPLLRLEVLANGFARIGMTRMLTRILDMPWPGAAADHEVVLEVEEQLF
jgi:hypothetical protein